MKLQNYKITKLQNYKITKLQNYKKTKLLGLVILFVFVSSCKKEFNENANFKLNEAQKEQVINDKNLFFNVLNDVTSNKFSKLDSETPLTYQEKLAKSFVKHSSINKSESEITNLVGKVDFLEYFEKRQILQNLISIGDEVGSVGGKKIQVADPNGGSNPVLVVQGISEIFEAAQPYLSTPVYNHVQNAGQVLENNALSFVQMADANQNPDPTDPYFIAQIQNSYYQTLTTIESQITSDLSLTTAEKSEVLMVFLFVKSTITSQQFGENLLSLINSGSHLESIASIGSDTGVLSLGSFFKKVGQIIAGAVVIAATTAVSALIGNALLPGIGAVVNGLGGFYQGFSFAHDLFPTVFGDPKELF